MVAGLLLSLFLSQLPRAPGETSVVCHCKAGLASACQQLARTDPEKLRNILRALSMAHAAQEGGKDQAQATDAVDSGCSGGQPPNDDDKKTKCEGQLHHVISKKVWTR